MTKNGLGGPLALAVLEPVAFPVHLQDVDVVGESIQQRAGSEPRTSVHSWNGKLLVTSVEPRS